MKPNLYPIADVPKNVQQAKPDAHFNDEKAIVVSMPYGEQYFVGNYDYPRDVLGEKLEKMLKENPSEKQLIYLNAGFSNDYGNIVRALDIIRKTGIENVGLMVEPGNAADKKLQVLKVKMTAEPKADDPEDLYDKKIVVNLEKDGKAKIGRIDKYTFKPSAPDVAAADAIAARLAPLLKENEEKKINLRGTTEIDKTVFVKGRRSNRYADVVRFVDAALSAGAAGVYLQIDDLEE